MCHFTHGGPKLGLTRENMTLMKGAQTDLGNEMKCNLIDLTQFCRNRNTSNDVQLSFVRKVIYLAELALLFERNYCLV